MSEPTTLERCASFFERTGWSGRLRHNVSGPRCFYYLLIPDGDEPDWAFTLTDDEATALIKDELWRRIQKAKIYQGKIRREKTAEGYEVQVGPLVHTGPDELALLLQAAEEVTK